MTTVTVTLLPRTLALTVDVRPGAHLPSLILLEDGSGYLLSEDGSRLMTEAGDTGTALTLLPLP